ncbi:MAG: hypothetical protein AAGE65_07490 [Planctomycetota bacterium]
MFKRLWRSDTAPTAPSGDGPTAVLVGHCGFDSGGLTRVLRDALPGVQVESARSLDALERFADAGALLLVNRVPEGNFGGRDGVELIRHLTQRTAESQTEPGDDAKAEPSAILISNYADAQAQAEAVGAKPGFGKSEMNTPQARQRLLDAVQA